MIAWHKIYAFPSIFDFQVAISRFFAYTEIIWTKRGGFIMQIQDAKKKEEGSGLAEETVRLLIEKKWHISFAESCTGGLAAARLVEVANASAVLEASVITYANAAKVKYAGVSPDAIEAHGVVSEEVAGEMARGIARENHAEVGVGISGIAGPTGGSAAKPVGMVCFGFWINGQLETDTMQFGALGRNVVREKSVEYAYRRLEGLLKGIPG